nr:neural cell adhesion molecule 2-like [Vanessa tameamea]
MKWFFYVIVFIYMFYRAVYGSKSIQKETRGLSIENIDYGPDKAYYNAGVRKSIICKGTNKNQKVEWINPSGNVVQRVVTNRVFTQEHFVPAFRTRIPAMVLVISHANLEDTGVWECRSGAVKRNVSLCIIDPSEFVDTPTEVTVDRGRSITLSCQAKGEPEPRLLWHRNGEIITEDVNPSKYQVMTKYNSQGFEGLLTITSLEPQDSGVYNCDAIQESPNLDDCTASTSLNITLLVNYAPMFEDGNDTALVPGKENESVDLVCASNAHPTPIYRWFKEDGDILSEFSKDEIKLIDDGEKAVLTLVANESTFGQRYRCRSSNLYGEVDKIFAVLKLEKPRKPTEISVENVTHDAIHFQVKWHGEILFPVDEVLIQYMEFKSLLKKRVGTPRDVDWKKAEEALLKIDGYDIVDGKSSGFTLTLPELNEKTEYWVRVRASNEAGDSLWSEPILASTVEQPEIELVEEVDDEPEPVKAAQISDGTFYGIFFVGGILVVGIGCMFAMRMV